MFVRDITTKKCEKPLLMPLHGYFSVKDVGIASAVLFKVANNWTSTPNQLRLKAHEAEVDNDFVVNEAE